MKRALLVCVAVAACGQSGLNRPWIGMMVYADEARAVVGLPGSLTAGAALAGGVVSLGCAAICLIKTDSQLISAEGAVSAPAGPALFAFDSSGAFVYFSRARQLARWEGGQLTPLDFQAAGKIVSMRSVNGSPEFAVRMGGEIRVVRRDRAVVEILPRAARAVMLLDDGVLFSTAEEIVLRRGDAADLRFPLSGAASFVAMSGDYVEIRSLRGIFALRITPGREQLFELPEPKP